jgi:type 2 lantibiotic biosynthesis protein LanM
MDDSLRAIAAKASSIRERLAPDFVASGETTYDETIEARMRAWVAKAAKGDVTTFRRRLAWEGLDENLARRAVGPARLKPEAPLPRWVLTLAEVLQLAGVSKARARCLDDRKLIPFEDLLVPFVTWARSACERKAGSAYACFDDLAHADLERQLLESLSACAAKSLLLELSLEVSEYESPLDEFSQSEPSRAGYEAFVARMLNGGLVSFLEEYSVLARVLSITTELWVEATVEMLERFRTDVGAIRAMLNVRGEAQVARVASSLSDPHHGLRTVAILAFDSGERVVYKPRPLGMEVAWNVLLGWLPSIGSPIGLRTFRVLDRGDHGWAEYVEYATCANCEEARRYFRRAGGLLSLVYLLHGTDCHANNVIAAGEHPVLIDIETILLPQSRDLMPVGAEAPRLARKLLMRSVITTHLLPLWSRGVNDPDVFDGSGFGADVDQECALTWQRWLLVNTDRMRLGRGSLEEGPTPRAALSNGQPLRVFEYESDLVDGFAAMYRFLVRERNTLLSPESPFQSLRNAQVRFVYRNTELYSTILDRLNEPDLLRDGAERSLEIEQLAVAALIGEKFDGRSGWVKIWNAEREAIECGDVPHFTALASGDSLSVASNVTIPGWFTQPSHTAVVERLDLLDEADLAFQVDLIRSALRSRSPIHATASASGEVLDALSATPRSATGNGELWIAEAVEIAESLTRDAIRGSDGSLSWLQPAWSRELMLASPKREFDVVGNDLYDGAVGIGMFLAAVERVTGGAALLTSAMGAVRPLLVELTERGEETVEQLGIGGLSGLGSVVYGLVCMSKLLDETSLLWGAERAASLITPERIDNDLELDVTLGSAGALLGLLTLYETNGHAPALARAVQCGQRLIARLEPAGRGVRALRTLGGRFLTGFSHGAAGIAYALCRLHAVTQDANYLEAARALVEFERSSFSVEHGDWPDLRQSGPARFVAAWCHGAPGIALGRIASLGSMHDEETHREINRALEITQRPRVQGTDYLCCGTFGVVDILWTAGRLLNRPELCQRAQSLAWQTVSTSKDTGGYALGLPSVGQFTCRGLFQGLTGIGYVMLRLARPDLLPELLLLR